MPRIYELPAQTGAEPDLMAGGPVQRSQPQQPQGSANPRQMLAGQMDQELNNVTRMFDVNVSALDQQMLEPDKYKTQYANLQRQASNQRIAIQAKHEAAARQIKNMQKLVEAELMSPEQMQINMLDMAGMPVNDLKAAVAQRRRQKPIARMRDLIYIADRMERFRARFTEKKGKLYRVNPDTGKRGPLASEAEIKEYNTMELRLQAGDEEMQQLRQEISPLEQTAMAGTMAVRQFGAGKKRNWKQIAQRAAMGTFGLTLPGRIWADAAKEQPAKEPKSKADYDDLPKGARYRHPDGDVRTKK